MTGSHGDSSKGIALFNTTLGILMATVNSSIVLILQELQGLHGGALFR